MTKKEMLATLRPFAAPLPDKDTQLKRCMLAVNVIKPFLDTFEKGIKASKQEHQEEARKLVDQIAKVRRWHTEATLSLPVLERHSAILRRTKALQKGIAQKMHVIMVDDTISAPNAYAAWGRVCFEVLAEATCTAKDYAKSNAWRHLDTTLHTMQALGQALPTRRRLRHHTFQLHGDSSMTKEYTPCPTCGGNPNLQRSCCTHEKLRRARKRRDSTKCATPTASGICENCGGNTTIARICCDVERRRRNALYTASNRQKQIIKEKNRIQQIAEKGPHVCYDCGTPTPDRRCDRCRAKWNAKHGVSSSSHSLSADWQGF